jgi:hypothetical protein
MNDDHDFKRHDGGQHTGLARSSPYPLSRMARPYDLVDLAREIARADAMMTTVIGGKLELIADQIRRLQAQAHALMAAAERDAALHRVECRFQKQPGGVYHLYERPDGVRYFSLLAPADWGHRPPHGFVGSFRLNADMSFAEVAEEG